MTAITDGNENESLSSLAQETVTIDGEPTVIIDTSDSSSPVVETDQVYDAVSSIKEEDVCINAVEFNDSPPVGFPKAVVGLHEMGPTPFLKKTFEMVDDAVTNPVVSWSPTRESFIIWDSYKFSETLLPRYFKHRNFSSFVRQLNTYGFRKVDTDRWEFANKEFQGGNKHLLKNIKRRCKIKSKKDTSVDTEVESLKKDQSSMRLEILKLKQQQEEYHHQMVIVQEKIHVVESKQQHMLSFFTKLAKEQRFVERLMRKMRKSNPQRDLEATEFVKQLKLLQDQETLVSDMIIREGLTMAATQSNPESDIVMNDESGYTTCQLNTEELLVEGLIGEDSSFVDVNENSGGEEWSDTKTISSPVLRN